MSDGFVATADFRGVYQHGQLLQFKAGDELDGLVGAWFAKRGAPVEERRPARAPSRRARSSIPTPASRTGGS